MSATANQIIKAIAETMSPAELEQHRIDRLRELRRTIDALRHEQATSDPLLAWVIQHERAESAPNT